MASARKGWNDAMKATAPSHVLRTQQRRRSERRGRRPQKQHRSTTAAGGLLDSVELQRALWVDTLEGVDISAAVTGEDDNLDGDEDDDVYDAFEELDGDGNNKKRKKKKPKRKTNRKPNSSKRFQARSLGAVLLEEASREDGIASELLATHATTSTPLPQRHFCSVTGLPGRYRDPTTGLWYSTYGALEQIRERPPPWMSLSGGANATFLEAVRSIEDHQQRQHHGKGETAKDNPLIQN